VRVQDESGTDWLVYEHDPDIDSGEQHITCRYDFTSPTADEPGYIESLRHHYLLPEQLVHLLDKSGFEIEELSGDFRGASFDPEESEHLVIKARRSARS
jgi:hypothetical protein